MAHVTAEQAKDLQDQIETFIETLGHRVASIYDQQRGVLKLFIDPPSYMSPSKLEQADDEYRMNRWSLR